MVSKQESVKSPKSQVGARIADNLKMNPISISAQNSGLAAITTGSRKLSQDAQQIANPDRPDITGSLVDLNPSLVQAEAGANVINTENRMLGTLLDSFA
jgi:hypothetical protein